MSEFETLEIKFDHPIEKVITLILNRPKALNAISRQMVNDLEEAITLIEKEQDKYRALVITGGGDKAFVAGADISQMVTMTAPEARHYLYSLQQILNRIEQLNLPVIARINGYALGGGLEIALACDIRIASDKAILGLPEVSLGLIPAAGGTQRLTRIVGQGIAKHLILTGKRISAQKALEYHIINEVAPHEELDQKVLDMLKEIMKMGPIAISAAKKSIEVAFNESLRSGLEIELTNAVECFQSDDLREGMKAFLEKRPAEFKRK